MNYENMVGIPKDYSKKENWLRFSKVKKDVDLIWLYPTCSMSMKVIGDVDFVHSYLAKRATSQMVDPIFSDSCNVFAPYYRQLSGMKLSSLSFDEICNFRNAEPRTDMYAALDYYFENVNDGRPYILAGHSQGAQMVSLILTEYMKLHPDVYSRMIAAYCVGFGISYEDLALNPHIKPATSSSDTGVLISWNTEAPCNKGKRNFVVVPNSFVINPLNWKTDETYASVEENIGVFGADAQIDIERSSVICSSMEPSKYAAHNALATYIGPLGNIAKPVMAKSITSTFGPGSFHYYDYVFYAENIKENVKERINAYMS